MGFAVECPECAAQVTLADDVMAGEIIQCAECEVELETVQGESWSVVRAPEEEEDWGE